MTKHCDFCGDEFETNDPEEQHCKDCRCDDKVTVRKIQFLIAQAERKIEYINRNSVEVVA